MLLYVVSKDNIGDWNLEAGSSYTVKNQLFESDIYCDFLATALEVTLLPNSNVQLEFDANETLPLNLLSTDNDTESTIAGSFCTLNDVWLDAGNDNALVISSSPLTLTKTSLDRIKRAFKNNFVYNLPPIPPVTTATEEDHPVAPPSTANDKATVVTATDNQQDTTPTSDAAADAATPQVVDRVMGSYTPSGDLDDTMVDDESGLGTLHPASTGSKAVMPPSSQRVLDTLIAESSIFKRFGNWLFKVLHLEAVMENKYVKATFDGLDAVFPWVRQNLLLTVVSIVVLAVLVVGGLVLIGFSNDSNVGIQLTHQASYYDEQTLMDERRVKQVSAVLPIMNRNVYQQYNHFVVSGIVAESPTLKIVKQSLRKELPGIPLVFHLFTLSKVQDGVATLEDDFQLNCNYDPHLTRVTCFGMVDDKDNAKEQIFNEYQYNEVLPMDLNLSSTLEVQTYLNVLLNNPALLNVRYSLNSDGTLTLYGYVSERKLAYLNDLLRQALHKIPFLRIIDNLKLIERAIDLRVKQIIFNDYGNTLVDDEGNEYNVGSQYKNFIITSIQKNSVILRNGSSIITLATPFNTDTVNVVPDDNSVSDGGLNNASSMIVNESGTPLGMSASNDSLMGDIPPIIDSNYSTGSEANADSKTIIKGEVAKQIADVNEKKQILNELRQAQDNNTNPALKHSYSDLIDNITSDINNEEQNVSAASQQ